MDRDMDRETEILARLSEVLEQRKNADPDSSYVASLYAKGLNKILEKVGEEATEVLLASRDLAQGTTDGTTGLSDVGPDVALETALVGEVADLWFHSMVMLTHPHRVLDELAKRFGVSGIEEKRNRK